MRQWSAISLKILVVSVATVSVASWIGVSSSWAAAPTAVEIQADLDGTWANVSTAAPGEQLGVKTPNNQNVLAPGETSVLMSGIGGIGDIEFAASEVTVETVIFGNNFYEQARFTLPEDMELGSYYVTVTTPDGTSNRLVIAVGNYRCVNQVTGFGRTDVIMSFDVNAPGEVFVGEPILLDDITATMRIPQSATQLGTPVVYPQGDIYWEEGDPLFMGENSSIADNLQGPTTPTDPPDRFGSIVTWQAEGVSFPAWSEPGTFTAIPAEWRYVVETLLGAFGFTCIPHTTAAIATVEVVEPSVSTTTTTTVPPDGSTTTTTNGLGSSTTTPGGGGGGSGGGSGSGSAGASGSSGSATPRYTG